MDGNGPLDNSTLYGITGAQLMIANMSAISDGKDKAIQCCEVLNNGIVLEGVKYNVEPLSMSYVLCGNSIYSNTPTHIRCIMHTVHSKAHLYKKS